MRLTFSLEEYIAPQIATDTLVRVLDDWCSPLLVLPLLPEFLFATSLQAADVSARTAAFRARRTC